MTSDTANKVRTSGDAMAHAAIRMLSMFDVDACREAVKHGIDGGHQTVVDLADSVINYINAVPISEAVEEFVDALEELKDGTLTVGKE